MSGVMEQTKRAVSFNLQEPVISLDWSPDGEILAAVSPHEIVFFLGSGTLLQKLTGLASPADPLWVNAHEVWYEDANDQGKRVMSVQLQ